MLVLLLFKKRSCVSPAVLVKIAWSLLLFVSRYRFKMEKETCRILSLRSDAALELRAAMKYFAIKNGAFEISLKSLYKLCGTELWRSHVLFVTEYLWEKVRQHVARGARQRCKSCFLGCLKQLLGLGCAFLPLTGTLIKTAIF